MTAGAALVLVDRHGDSAGEGGPDIGSRKPPGKVSEAILVALQWLLVPPLLVLTWAHLVAGVGYAVQAADRGEPVRIDARVLSLVVREAVARALWWTVGLVARVVPEPAPKIGPGERRVPVVLVPGMTLGRSSLWGLATFLRQRGFATVHAVDRSGEGTLAAEAEALGRSIAAVQAATGAAEVDLVAFSTGGLVAAWYLRHHEAGRVRRLVTIGTPWRGTKLAVFSRAPGASEVRYGAHALDGLWPLPVPTVCVFSPDDPVVVPATSAVPEHGADAVRVEAGGHVDLLLSARVYRAVQAALERPLAASAPAPTLVPEPPPAEPV